MVLGQKLLPPIDSNLLTKISLTQNSVQEQDKQTQNPENEKESRNRILKFLNRHEKISV